MRPVLSAAVLIAALAPAAGPVAAEDDAPLGPVFMDKLVADCAAFAADPAKAAEEAPRSVSSMGMSD